MRARSWLLLVAIIAFLLLAPVLFGAFTITLMNYIGIYSTLR